MYIINNTSKPKKFYSYAGYGLGIQEAQFRYYWHPIEKDYTPSSGMGNITDIINPNEFIILLFNKYEGEHKTNLRLRISQGDNIWVTVPFEGFINQEQRTLTSDFDIQRLLKNPHRQLHWYFGARPYLSDEQIKRYK